MPRVSLSVSTDRRVYRPGDLVRVVAVAYADGRPLAGAAVGFQWVDPRGNYGPIHVEATDRAGMARWTFRLSPAAPEGRWGVVARLSGLRARAEAEFHVGRAPAPPPQPARVPWPIIAAAACLGLAALTIWLARRR